MCACVRRFARVWASVGVSDTVPSRARRPLAEWLQANCSKFKKIFESEDVLAEKLKELSVSGEAKAAKDKPKLLPGGKVKKNAKPEIVLERSVRNKRKCITTVSGLDTFGIKLPEAAKLLGKKFACGCGWTITDHGSVQRALAAGKCAWCLQSDAEKAKIEKKREKSNNRWRKNGRKNGGAGAPTTTAPPPLFFSWITP